MTSIDDWSHRVKAALLRRVQSGFLILTVAGRAQLPAARRWGRLGTPASGRHSPPEAGGGKDSQLRGGPFSAGISAFGGIRTLEWQTPFVAVRTTCLRFVKADGKEPPVALGSLCRVPPGETRMIGPSAHQARQKMPRHSRWLGAASSVLVSRSRACRPEAGVPIGFSAPVWAITTASQWPIRREHLGVPSAVEHLAWTCAPTDGRDGSPVRESAPPSAQYRRRQRRGRPAKPQQSTTLEGTRR